MSGQITERRRLEQIKKGNLGKKKKEKREGTVWITIKHKLKQLPSCHKERSSWHYHHASKRRPSPPFGRTYLDHQFLRPRIPDEEHEALAEERVVGALAHLRCLFQIIDAEPHVCAWLILEISRLNGIAMWFRQTQNLLSKILISMTGRLLIR